MSADVRNMTDILFVKNVPITVVQHGQETRYFNQSITLFVRHDIKAQLQQAEFGSGQTGHDRVSNLCQDAETDAETHRK